MPDGSDQRVRKGRKFDQVLTGAREIFMSDGYEGASVDDIARAAGVSKATLYSYFPDKQILFMEVARNECARQAELGKADITALEGDPRRILGIAGRRMMEVILSPLGRNIFRICVAESERFPELGREFYRSGPMMVRQVMIDYFNAAIARQELVIDDCEMAADQFAEMCKADLFPRMVFGMLDEVRPQDIDRVVDAAVETFMARYGAAPAAP